VTRRAPRRAGKALSLNAYVHRATLGLPKPERLDAAAELRAHLLEQVSVLEAKGFAREEAEFLAVQAMGNPQVTNRQLLGHLLTTPLGWGVLGIVVLGLGGWWASEQLKVIGIRPSVIVQTDYVALSHVLAGQWPHGWGFGAYQMAADIHFPNGTKNVLAAFVNYGDPSLRPSFTFPLSASVSYGSMSSGENIDQFDYASTFWQGHFRMAATAAPELGPQPFHCSKGKYMLGDFIYSTDKPKLPKGTLSNVTDGIYGLNGVLGGLCLPDLGNRVEFNPSPLALNTWSRAYQLFGFPQINNKQSKKPIAFALLLFPTDRPIEQITKQSEFQPEKAFAFNTKSYQWEPTHP
jgi:hypothetical protein